MAQTWPTVASKKIAQQICPRIFTETEAVRWKFNVWFSKFVVSWEIFHVLNAGAYKEQIPLRISATPWASKGPRANCAQDGSELSHKKSRFCAAEFPCYICLQYIFGVYVSMEPSRIFFFVLCVCCRNRPRFNGQFNSFNDKQLKLGKYPEWLDMTSLKNNAQLANRPEWCDRSQFSSRILSMN